MVDIEQRNAKGLAVALKPAEFAGHIILHPRARAQTRQSIAAPKPPPRTRVPAAATPHEFLIFRRNGVIIAARNGMAIRRFHKNQPRHAVQVFMQANQPFDGGLILKPCVDGLAPPCGETAGRWPGLRPDRRE